MLVKSVNFEFLAMKSYGENKRYHILQKKKIIYNLITFNFDN